MTVPMETMKRKMKMFCFMPSRDAQTHLSRRNDMNQAIPVMEMPVWLTRQTAETMVNEPLPLEELLENSLYYAGAGFDGTPVECFAGNVFSFVYTDYLAKKRDVLAQLRSRRDGFRGYRLVGIRELELEEVFPRGVYGPAELDYRFWTNERQSPGSFMERAPRPFALWAVFERESAEANGDSPARFSLLHVCYESVAAYAGLYVRHGIVPKIIYLINHGFGANWTDFEDPERIYARTVACHPLGLPSWLVARSNRKTCDCTNREDARNYWEPFYPGAPDADAGNGRGFMVWRKHPDPDRKKAARFGRRGNCDRISREGEAGQRMLSLEQ